MPFKVVSNPVDPQKLIESALNFAITLMRIHYAPFVTNAPFVNYDPFVLYASF